MKKIPKSITVTVRVSKNGTVALLSGHWRNTHVSTDLIRRMFGKAPSVGFHRVTYTENARGAYTVSECYSGGFATITNSRGGSIRPCFFRGPWNGLRVSRRVEKVKK